MNNICIANRFNLNTAILSIHKTGNGVSLVTQDYQACVIENDSLKKRVKLIDSAQIPHKFAKSSSASEEFICMCEYGKPSALIARIGDTITKNAMISSHIKSISASNFSIDSRFLATGGEDGRVYIYTTHNFKRILKLPYRPDYISSINFSRDSRFLFISCFDKSNIIFDIERAKTISIFNTSEVVEWGGFFENNAKLLLITRDFKSIIYDTRANKTLKIANFFTSWPNTFYIDISTNIAIVGTREGEIYLINIKDNSLIFKWQLEGIVGISAICVHLGRIFVGGINGELLIISYTENSEDFQKACEAKNYAKASDLLESNIFLSLLSCAKIFDDDWEDILQQAVVLLGENKIDDAISLTEPFTRQDIRKKEAFDVFLNQKDSIKAFKDAVEQKRYDEAYYMALNARFLTKTGHYETLESAWHIAFGRARKVLEENPLDINGAKKHLTPFMKTPRNDAIMQLLNNAQIFDEADKYIKKQDFKAYFALVNKFAVLKDGLLYKKVLALGANTFDKLVEARNANNYEEFFRLCGFLLAFPSYKESVAGMMIATNKKLEILKLIEDNKKAQVYALALEFEELQYLDEFKVFCEEFAIVASRAMQLAYSGKPHQLDVVFGEYMRIAFWRERMSAIYQIAYLEEFKQSILIEKDAINWEQSVKNYVQIFGKDDDINFFCNANGFKCDGADFARQPFSFQKTLLSRVV